MAEKLKITEGPWRAELVDEFNRQPYYAIMQAEGVIRSRIGTVDIAIDDDGWERPSSKANARAIASLPALIEAAELVDQQLQDGGVTEHAHTRLAEALSSIKGGK